MSVVVAVAQLLVCVLSRAYRVYKPLVLYRSVTVPRLWLPLALTYVRNVFMYMYDLSVSDVQP